MAYIKKLAGDHVYLSPYTASDEEAQKFTEWINDFAVTDYLTNSSSLITLPAEREWLANSTTKDAQNRSFAIVSLEDDRLIGSITLGKIDPTHRTATLGIFIGDADFRGKGFGTEAINLILEYGFRYLNLHSVQLAVLDANPRAVKCYEKCGFKKTGRGREQFFINGKYHDSIQMDVLDREFKGNYIRNKNL